MTRRLVFIGALIALMAASGLLGWRANITFEPNPIHYVPVPVRNTLTYYHWYLPRGSYEYARTP